MKSLQLKQLPCRLLLLVLLFTAACDTSPGQTGRVHVPQVSTEPEREDIINAVRRGVNGKTYTENVVRWETVRHSCSQFDVDTDPYMPHNPELADCPRVGATYTERESYTETVTRQCDRLPDANSGWSVTDAGSDRWTVGYGGRRWNVELVSGASGSVGDTVQVSSFQFVITTNQNC